MNEYRVILNYKTETEYKEIKEIYELFKGQWIQTGAAEEGDTIEVIKVEKRK